LLYNQASFNEDLAYPSLREKKIKTHNENFPDPKRTIAFMMMIWKVPLAALTPGLTETVDTIIFSSG